MKPIRTTPVSASGTQGSLFGPSAPAYPESDVARGQKLRSLRYELNLTPAEAARRVGLTASDVSALEVGSLACDPAEYDKRLRSGR